MRHFPLVLLLSCMLVLHCSCGGGGAAGNPDEDPITAKAFVFAQHNTLRLSEGMAPFTETAILSTLAQQQAVYMASLGTWTHTNAAGDGVSQWINDAGYTCTVASDNADLAGSSDELWAGWVDEPMARVPILAATNDEIGIGMAVSGNTQYWCVIYAGAVTEL